MSIAPDPVLEGCPTLVFVAHGGALEAKSALLAASLADFYLPARAGHVVCRLAEPASHWGEVSRPFRTLLDRLGIDVRPVTNGIDPSYPHGNKIDALGGIHGPAVFLDSDMLLMVPLSWHFALVNAEMGAKPADLDTFGRSGGSWARVWGLFDLPLPGRTLHSTISDEEMRPYYNAGFIAAQDGDSLAEAWLDTARRIDAAARIGPKRPWLDQVALPVAAARLGWRVRTLGDVFNYPCHLAPLGRDLPYFAHYHWPNILEASPAMMHRLRTLLADHPELAVILGQDDEWHSALERCGIGSDHAAALTV